MFYSKNTKLHKYCNILVLSFPDDDDDDALKKTVDWLAKLFSNTKVEILHIIPEELNIPDIGHFGFFREHFTDSLWVMTEDWIEKNT